jgi:hypothetical protein
MMGEKNRPWRGDFDSHRDDQEKWGGQNQGDSGDGDVEGTAKGLAPAPVAFRLGLARSGRIPEDGLGRPSDDG